ncbi:MAG: hypothetical protein AAB434_07995 [Planctomycetota bacterium]
MPVSASNRHRLARFTCRALAAALLGLAAIGCTSTVGYETNPENVDLSAHRLPIKVAVLRMADARPQEQIATDGEFMSWWDKTEDEDWDHEDLAGAISLQAAKHLDASGIFASVTYVPHITGAPDAAALAELHAQGYDAAMVATIEHFTGTRRWDLTRGGVFALGGPIGTAANLALGHRAGGLVVFRPLMLLRTTDGFTIWHGEAFGDFEETAYFTGTAPGYANEALKLALNDLTKRFDTDSGDLAVRLSTRREEVTLPGGPIEEAADPTLVDSAVNPAKAGVQGAAKAASKAGETIDKFFDGVIDTVR